MGMLNTMMLLQNRSNKLSKKRQYTIHREQSEVKWRRESEDGNVEYNDVVTKQEEQTV